MKVLIAYYSRTGTTRKAAEAIRDALRAAGDVDVTVEEIVDTKDRSGAGGWLGAGKDSLRKRTTTIEPVTADVAAFDLVVVGTPVWASNVTPAARTFCVEQSPRAGQVAFFCTTGGTGTKRTLATMEDLCKKAPVATLGLVQKAVMKGDEAKFIAKVRVFADTIVGQATTHNPQAGG